MEKTNAKFTDFISAVGRRKEAVARVRLSKGSGQITINGKNIGDCFPGEIFSKIYNKPFELTKTLGQFNVSIKSEGGGQFSLLDAIVHGISRALSKKDLELRKIIKAAGLLTRDPRVKERRKFGLAHKARAKKQSPKR